MYKALSQYFLDNPFIGRFYKNVGIVFTGKAVSSIFVLLSIALMTRTLSLEQFGLYTLVISYIYLIERLTTFQTWQAMIYYGAKAREESKFDTLASLFLFGILLDIAAGVLGFSTAIIGAIYIPDWFGLQTGALLMPIIAASKLLFNWVAISTGLLRLYDRFVPIAISQNITALIQFIGVTVLWYMDETELLPYVVVATVSGVIGQLLLFTYAVLEANRQKIFKKGLVGLGTLPNHCQGIWRFVFTTNADGIVRALRDVDMFIVNFILGPTAVALYKIARVLTRALTQFTGPFYQAIYPELSQLFAESKITLGLKLMRQTSISLGLVISLFWVVFFIVGHKVLEFAFGPQYIEAYYVSIWCMAAIVVWSFSQSLSPAMLAVGKPEISLLIHLVTTVAYIILLFAFTTFFGVEGAGLALVAFYVLWSISMLVAFKIQVRTNISNS